VQFSTSSLDLDPAKETERIVQFLQQYLRQTKRRGAVVGISGGVDSAVVLALCVRAFGAARVMAIMMPDKDSDPLSEKLARELASTFGVTPQLEDITGALDGFGCYRRRDDAIRRVVPDYDPARGFKAKIVLPQDLLDAGTLNVFSLTVVRPDGHEETHPLAPREMLEIIAASNLKQRARMSVLYLHAETRQYAVIGTANKNEHAQGFFVKHGDGGVDIQALAHLFKTQVYQLARHLDVPVAIQKRTPTTDTYSAPSSQEEFFFRLPFATLDLIWFAMEHQVPAAEAGIVMGLGETQVQRVFDDLQRKQRTTEFLRDAAPMLDAPMMAEGEHASLLRDTRG
jgi:NAD+ synthase